MNSIDYNFYFINGKLANVLIRFLPSVICSILLTFSLLSYEKTHFDKFNMALLAYGIPFFCAFRLLVERSKWNSFLYWFLSLSIFYLISNSSILSKLSLYYLILNIATYLLILIAPFIFKKTENQD